MAAFAQIAANRANAQRSTSPKSPQGKARAASNSFNHGLYAPKHFQVYNADPNFTATLIHNLSDEFQPLTPSEHVQVHYTVLINYYASKPGTPQTTLVCQEELEDALSFERRTMKALRKQIGERISNNRNEANSDEPDGLKQIEDLRHMPIRLDKAPLSNPHRQTPNQQPTPSKFGGPSAAIQKDLVTLNKFSFDKKSCSQTDSFVILMGSLTLNHGTDAP